VQQLVGKSAQSSEVQRQLLDRINALLQSGTSMAQIVSTLASNLAQQVGATLGKTDDASLATLKSAFASALSPPGSSPPDAATLLDRLRRTAKIATAALTNTTGQQNRFPGNTLDATAGGNPAPNQTNQNQATANVNGTPAPLSPESILSGAFTALSGPIDSPQVAAALSTAQPPATQGTVPNATPPAPATAQTPSSFSTLATTTPPPVSTESLVAASSLDAAGTGGGTLLGRSLTRAANAAAALGPSPITALAPGAPGLPQIAAASAPQQGSADSKGGSTPNPGGSAATAALAAAGGSAQAAPDAALAAFVQTFQRALAFNANAAAAETPAATGQPSDGTAPAVSDTTAIGSAQSFLASLGIQSPQTPATSSAQPDTPVAAQTSPTTDPNAVVAQLVRGLTMSNLGTSSQVRLRLVPETLGDLSIKLNVDNTTGSVSASVLAQTPDARDALIANQGQLHRALADAGLKLSSFNVDLSNSGANMFGQQQPQPQHQQRFGSSQRSVLASEDTSGDSLSAVPSFAPPAMVAAGTGTLNYLV
jgi:hypothetical protein